MKKFLLSLLCLISVMAINAETYTFNMAEKHGSATINLSAWSEGDFTFTPAKESSSTAPAFNKSGDVRIYAKGTFTIECTNAKMKNISFTISSQGKKRMTTITSSLGNMTVTGADDYTCSWAGDANSVTFTVGEIATLGTESSKAGQLCFTDITIETGAVDAVVVAKPTFSVASGVFTEPFDLTLSAEEGNTIYYTLDGSNPTVDSDIYDGKAIRISEYKVVKAAAVNGQGVASSVATATYAFQNTANTAMTVAEALAWIEEGKDATTEQYIAGYITAIKNVNLEYGNAEYSIADAIDGTDALLVYRGNYLNGEKFTAENQIKVGDKVLIYGKLKDYNGTPEVDSYSRIVSFLEKATDEGGEEPGDDPVVPENPETATVVTFDFTAPSSLNPAQNTPEFGQQNSIIVNDVVFTAGNVSLSFDKGSAGTDCRIWAGNSAYDLRTYKNSTMTFTVTGAAITKIVFTGGKASTTQMSVKDGTFEGETWKGDSQSITFTAKATTNINTITVTYDTATGIEDTMVDENAPVEYYNLQGVKVANPENGIFIKKQGGRTSKVVL